MGADKNKCFELLVLIAIIREKNKKLLDKICSKEVTPEDMEKELKFQDLDSQEWDDTLLLNFKVGVEYNTNKKDLTDEDNYPESLAKGTKYRLDDYNHYLQYYQKFGGRQTGERVIESKVASKIDMALRIKTMHEYASIF